MKLITNKSKNLLYRIQPYSNCDIQFGTSYAIATQISADSLTALSYNCQYRKDSTYLMGAFSGNLSKPEKITRTFTTPADLDYNQMVFGVNGKSADTLVAFPIKLKPSTTYTFTCNFTNITQGSISWKDMMLVEGSEAGDYEPYSYNLLDKRQYPSTQTVNRVTFTNNGDGTITADGIPPSDTFYVIYTFNRISGHRYVVSCNYNRNVFTGLKMETQSGSGQVNFNPDNIFTATSTENTRVYIDVYDDHIGPSVVIPQLYDLTLMYGAGNEPTTVEQFYTDHPELKVSPLGFIGLKNLEISNKNIKRLKYKTSSGNVDLGIIPSNSGYILDKYNNLSEELLEENIEKDNINYHIPDKTNILLNKIEGKTNKIVQLLDKSTVNCSSVNDWIGGTGSDTNLRVANGVVSIDGTLGSYSGVRTQGNKPIIKGHKYYISTWAMCSKNASNVLLPYTYGFSSSTSTLTANEWKNAEKIDTANVSDTTSIGVRYGSGESSEETVVWSVKKPQFFDLTSMYGFGNEPTTVEQFKKDYPQFFDEKLDGIWNVRTSGISTTGKNLFDIDSVSFFTKVSNGEYKSNTYIGVYPNYVLWTPVDGTKQVTISGYVKCPVDKNYRFAVLYEDGTEASSYISSTGDYLYNSYTSDTSKKIKYVYLHYTNGSNEVYIKDVQIEEGSTATTYEPYIENKIDLLSTQTLNGINGVNDYIEVIDKGNGLYDLKKTQNIDSVDLGSLGFDVDGSNFVSGAMSSYIKPPANDNSVGNYICQKYVNCALNKSFVNGDFGVNSSGYVYFRNSTYTTANDFNAAVTGTMLYYQLKTPVTTTIATNLTYNQVSAIRTNGGLLLVNDNNNQKYVQPDVTLKENYQYKNG